MRNVLQFQMLAKLGEVFEQLADATIVRLEELPQHENGEQLMLGKIAPREAAGIQRQRVAGQSERFPAHCNGRLRQTAGHKPSPCSPTQTFALRHKLFSTSHIKVFNRALEALSSGTLPLVILSDSEESPRRSARKLQLVGWRLRHHDFSMRIK